MKAIRIAGRPAAIVAALALSLPAVSLAAGTAKQLQGTWDFVSINIVGKDGSKKPGLTRKGLIVFTPEGRYSTLLSNEDAKPFASGGRMTGTAEENKAVAMGYIAHIGRYTVDEKAGIVSMMVDASTFPNWTGATQKRTFDIKGDMLVVRNSARSANDGTGSEITYKRVK